MSTSVSRNICCIMFKFISFVIITMFAWLYVMVEFLITCGKDFHESIISLRRKVEAWAHKTSLTLSLFIEVPVLSQESERHVFVCQGYRVWLFLQFWYDIWVWNCIFCVVLLCVWVQCCHVRYDFRIKPMFGSSLSPVVCRRANVLFTLFVFVWV